MNAFNTVNLGAACIVTSTEHAKQLQIPESKWIYPLGGAGFKERDLCMLTPCLNALWNPLTRHTQSGNDPTFLKAPQSDSLSIAALSPVSSPQAKSTFTISIRASPSCRNSLVNILDSRSPSHRSPSLFSGGSLRLEALETTTRCMYGFQTPE